MKLLVPLLPLVTCLKIHNELPTTLLSVQLLANCSDGITSTHLKELDRIFHMMLKQETGIGFMGTYLNEDGKSIATQEVFFDANAWRQHLPPNGADVEAVTAKDLTKIFPETKEIRISGPETEFAPIHELFDFCQPTFSKHLYGLSTFDKFTPNENTKVGDLNLVVVQNAYQAPNGLDDEVRSFLAKTLEIVKHEKGTPMYDWMYDSASKTLTTREAYDNSDSFLAHFASIAPLLTASSLKATTPMEIYGPKSAIQKTMNSEMIKGLEVKFFSLYKGFTHISSKSAAGTCIMQTLTFILMIVTAKFITG